MFEAGRESRSLRRGGDGFAGDRLAARPVPGYNKRMNTRLKVTKIGNSAGVVLPKELLAHLDVAIGETLSVSKTPHGIELSVRDADFDAQMAVAREVMARRKAALRELAK
jgi:putative addiction module antidote